MKKKLLAVMLVVVMVLGSFSTVFADDETYTITLENAKAGHTYTAYQIFKGDVTETENELINLQWGDDAPASMKTAYPTAAAAAEALNGVDAREWAQGLTLTGGTALTADTDGSLVFEDLEPGYYVILDANNNEAAVEGDFSSAIIVQVVDTVSMKLKGSAPTSEKKVGDVNDSEKTMVVDTENLANVDYKDSADFDINDVVPFKLTATTADNVAAYTKYHITFQDKQCAGLDAPENYTIKVLGQTFTLAADGDAQEATTANGTKITVENATPDAGRTFAIKVTFEPTEGKYLNAECNSKDIVVTYTSVLNADAEIGATGNPNEMYIKYSNNPESDDDSEEGKTPDDKVIVFTYTTIVDKVDETGADLKGADFVLYKEVLEDYEGAQLGSEIKQNWEKKVKDAATALKDDKYYVVAGQKTGSAAGSTFEFKGIDDGTYVLVETTVPAGYNAWAAQEVSISATHTHDTDSNPLKLTELKASALFATENDPETGTIARKDGERTHTVEELAEGYAEIINNSGSILPETGGIGTTILYTLGGILVIGAGVLLVARRKMDN